MLAVACLLVPATVRAHGVVEQVVDMLVQVQGDRLRVRVHVPAAVVPDAKLPYLEDGTLNTAAIDEPLRILAAHIARNLDIQQADEGLGAPTAIATVNADRKSIDVDLTYPIHAGTAGISARLNAFQAFGWVSVVALVVGIEALRHRRIHDRPDQLTDAVQA